VYAPDITKNYQFGAPIQTSRSKIYAAPSLTSAQNSDRSQPLRERVSGTAVTLGRSRYVEKDIEKVIISG
jgi:hypothetical protein